MESRTSVAHVMVGITFMLALVISTSEVAYPLVPITGLLYEGISVELNCTDGTLDVECLISSYLPELVHFPSEVDMTDPNLEKCSRIIATFNTTTSSLMYTFNVTNPEDARTYADAFTLSMNSAFGITFHWQHTGSPPSVVVSYAGSGIPDMAAFTDDLRTKCLKSDIGGFSDALLSMVTKSSQSTVYLQAHGPSFEWLYNIIARYVTKIPPSEDSHTIDVLNLLGVSELAPSPYCSEMGLYSSNLWVAINSPWNATYISCEPAEATTTERGWYIFTGETDFWASFDFYDDLSPVEALSITFRGKVVPEFDLLIMAFMFLAATVWISILKRRLL